MSASTIVPGLNAPASSVSHPPITAAEPLRLSTRFTGSGSEYFRIWIVNLLLTLLTLGIYYPWAKARKLRYFHSQSQIDGHPLGFHGDPKKMLRGYALVSALFFLYGAAGNISPHAAVVSFAIVAAIWPALLKSAQQFRLANTSWRGLRFRFSGTLGGAYKALLPLFVPGLVQLMAMTLLPAPEQEVPAWFGWVTLAVVGATTAMFPYVWWNLKRYQHDHFVFGSLQTTLKTGPGSVYGVFLKAAGVGLLAAALAAAVVVGALVVVSVAGRGSLGSKGIGAIAGVIGFVAWLLAFQIVVRPYAASRMQNLLWSRTGNRSLRFESDLRFRPLMWLTLKNWVLIALTLGLYWPFAVVATARMKLEAIGVWTRIDPQTLVDQHRARHGEAAGDAAGDLFGLDIGY